ncbi:MAG: cupin [Pseudomonadota bacterium]
MSSFDLSARPVHLGLGAKACTEPQFTGDMAWYADYAARHGADGNEGRLVSMHDFSKSWDVWEMHPNGAEVVVCVSGELTLRQEIGEGEERLIRLTQGQYAINEPGVWHTADVAVQATALFITAGAGTEHRPR